MIVFFSNKVLVFLLAFFSPMIINIGGEVSPSFLFIGLTFPLWHKYLPYRNDENYRYILRLFKAILCVQILWIPFSDTLLMDQVKGILVVVSGMIFFMFYYMVYLYNKDVVKWAAFGTFLASFVFIDVLVEMEGSDFGMWKFQIMPRLVSLCAVIYLWISNNKKLLKISPFLFIGVGVLGLATGARSTGLTPFLAGTLTLFLQSKRHIKVWQIKKYIIYLLISCYSLYAIVYVPNVLNGNISSGNSEQLRAVENPYNPINLLMFGRVTSIVPFIAFFDRPLTGWGYMAEDPNGKYVKLAYKIQDADDIGVLNASSKSVIPRHSGWGDLSCSYGIIAFLAIFLMLMRCFKLLFESFVVCDKYLLYRIYISFSFLWNLLFSPLAHFKYSPMSLAIIIVFSVTALNNQNKGNAL